MELDCRLRPGVVGVFGFDSSYSRYLSGGYPVQPLRSVEGVPDGTLAVRRINLLDIEALSYAVALPDDVSASGGSRLVRFFEDMSRPVVSVEGIDEISWMADTELLREDIAFEGDDAPLCACCFAPPPQWEEEETEGKPKSRRGWFARLRDKFSSMVDDAETEDDDGNDIFAEKSDGVFGDSCASVPDEERLSELELDLDLDMAKKEWVDQVTAMVLDYVTRFHEVPDMGVIEEAVRGKLSFRNPKGLSPVHVNGNLRIVLPAYNEMELRMTPLARTVYIFFLCHPEGVMLSEVCRYAAELEQIYMLVKPTADERRVAASIADLVSPTGESLQQKLSMTRRAVRRQIMHPHIAAHYMIKGDRGGRFGIDLPARMRKLPAILR